MKPTPESQGVLLGIQSRLLVRGSDPVTSRAAAVGILPTLTARQEQALAILLAYGPGTTHELARAATRLDDSAYRATAIHHELARRLCELARKGRAEVVQDPRKPCRCKPGAKACHCRDVIRDGCRVWRARRDT